MRLRDLARRKALIAFVAGALAASFPALGQDPRLSEAHSAGMAWLVLADADDATGTFDTAAKRFHEAMPRERWAQALRAARDQFGKNLRRTIVAVQPSSGTAAAPGEFVVMIFRAEFEKRPDAVETLTLEREADGKWRVAGYLMR
ncbi:MAG: DUF4019 domain-containing protein [Burkholderiales bacterium]|nr:DUF4019 domain-containing protein [Burkholderiales bacterium]